MAVADARGIRLADRFPENQVFIEESLGADGANQPVVRRLPLQRGDDRLVTVSVEVGRLELHDATWGGYAVLSDVSKLVEAEDPTIKRLIKEGYESFVVLPIRGEKRVLATLSLISKQAGFFDEKDYALLREIPLEKAVRIALVVAERKENHFLDRLFRRLNDYSCSKQVAEELIKSLSGFYRWQCVTIVKVNPVRKKLELIAQHQGPEDGFRLPEYWEQNFYEEIMGKVHRTGVPITQGDVEDDDNYSPILPWRRYSKLQATVF